MLITFLGACLPVCITPLPFLLGVEVMVVVEIVIGARIRWVPLMVGVAVMTVPEAGEGASCWSLFYQRQTKPRSIIYLYNHLYFQDRFSTEQLGLTGQKVQVINHKRNRLSKLTRTGFEPSTSRLT